MHDRRLVAGIAALALLAVAILAFILLSPRWAVAELNRLAQARLDRTVTATGGTHLDFSPLSIRIEGATLSGPGTADDSFIRAQQMVIPVSLGQLLRRRPDLSTISLDHAEFALLINERGEANWDFPGLAGFAPTTLQLDQASFRYYDARNDQSLTLSNVDGVLTLAADGGVTLAGTAVVNSRLLRINAELKSLARVEADGSPLELAVASDDGQGDFSGRLSTAKVLSLSGPVSLSANAAVPALRLLGLPLPPGAALDGPVAIDGVLDSAGRAYAIRNATLSLGAFRAAGDVVADLRGERPKLQASLAADNGWLDGFVPSAGAGDGHWGRAPLPFDVLRSFDAEVGIDFRSLAYNGYTAGPSRLKATLADGKFDTLIAAQLGGGGTANAEVRADAKALPPSLALSLDVQDAVVEPLLAALIGARGLTGTGDFAADLAATGKTEEEMIGTLKGKASLALTEGHIAGTDLGGLMLAARQKILEGWQAAPGGSDFTTLNGEAAIADGAATLSNASVVTPTARYAIQGIADLLRQALDLSVSPTAADGQPLLSVPLIVRGPWARPRIYPDIPNILTNPEGGFARLQDVTPPEAGKQDKAN